MSVFGDYIKQTTPKFNEMVVEGLSYHTMKNAIERIEENLIFTSEKRTSTHLKFRSIRMLSPEEEVALTFKKNNKYPYKLEENSTVMTELLFQYADHEEVLVQHLHVPYAKKGNEIMLSDKPVVAQPTLSDLVISIGERAIFINIVTAKHNFLRINHQVRENNSNKIVIVGTTELYKNRDDKWPDTTKAKPSVIHYLLATHGYQETVMQALGFVPELTYDAEPMEGKVVISSSGTRPTGWLGKDGELAGKSKQIKDEQYVSSKICFIVDEKDYNPNVLYVLGNIMYVIDNFPEMITIQQMDVPQIWRRFMGEIILGGRNTMAHRAKFMNIHFTDLESQFDTDTIRKLEDNEEPIYSKTLIELLMVIFKNFNTWISRGNSRCFYGNKSLESSSFILKGITSGINKVYLDVNKEEMRINKEPVDIKIVKAAFKEHLRPYIVFGLKKEKLFITSMENVTDHLYFNRTCMMVYQESDFINVNMGTGGTAARKKLVGSMCTIGSILRLPKKDQNCLANVNPYITLDPFTFTVLPNPDLNHIVQATDEKLAMTHIGSANDIGDGEGFTGLMDDYDYGDDEYEIDYEGSE